MSIQVHWVMASIIVGKTTQVHEKIWFYKEQLLDHGKRIEDLSYRDIERGLKQRYDESCQICVLKDLGLNSISKYRSNLRKN